MDTMMKLVEEKGSPKRDHFRFSKSRSSQKSSMRCNLLEAMAQVHGGDVVSSIDHEGGGTVRMKILVKKHDLQHMLEMIGGGKEEDAAKAATLLSSFSSMLTLEQRLNVMRRRQQKRADNVRDCRSSWCPVLQSIPEEL